MISKSVQAINTANNSQSNKAALIKVTLFDVDFLLFFLPTITCLMFWISTFSGTDIQIGSYFDLCISFYMYRIAFKSYRSAVFLGMFLIVFISLFYTFVLGTTINSAFTYITILHNILFALWLYPKLDFSEIDPKKLRTHLLIFVVLFIIMYELSVPYAKKKRCR